MKRNLSYNLVWLVCVLWVLPGCRHGTALHDTYTCPMHPMVIREQPGNCPVCNMTLVKKVKETNPAANDESAVAAHLPGDRITSSINTIRGNFATKTVEMTVHGLVTYDSRTLVTISARVAGRLEKVFLRYPYQRVHKGYKVAEIYSPELSAAQRELLYLLENDSDNESLIDAARHRLRNLGMTEKQIHQVTTSKVPQYAVAVFSPADGFVIPRGGQAPGAAANSAMSTAPDDMPASNVTPDTEATTSQGSTQELPQAGSYVTTGQPLFTLVNLSSLLIEVNLPPAAALKVKRGDNLLIHLDGKLIKTPIDLVPPFAQAGEQFIKVRSYLRGTSPFTVGQLITATLRLPPVEGLWVPLAVVHDMGTRHVVFVKEHEQFSPVEVVTGVSAGDQVVVVSGIATTDEIAANAQFLVDNEGFIKIQ